MALTRYVARMPPQGNFRVYLFDEFKRVQISIDSILDSFTSLRAFRSKSLDVEVGPPDSAGVGYRTLRIRN